MSKKYTVAELVWKGEPELLDGYFVIYAETPFGSYSIERYGDRITWGYRFQEYYDQKEFECDSLEDGKAKAWDHWNERLSSALKPA